jgi:hypothetical protein
MVVGGAMSERDCVRMKSTRLAGGLMFVGALSLGRVMGFSAWLFGDAARFA